MTAWLTFNSDTVDADGLLSRLKSETLAQVRGPGLERFCTITDGKLVTESKTPVGLDNIYEISTIGESTELRALKTGDQWRVSTCTEHDKPQADSREVERFDHDILVWGEAEPERSHGEWTTLRSKRVPEVAVPIATQGRAVITIAEYRTHSEVGNAYPLHSRMVRISAADSAEPD